MARKPPSKPPAKPQSPRKPPPTVTEDPLVGELEQRLAPLVPADKRGQVAQVMISVISENYSGPIAHPKHLAEFERIQPGAADRIIAMAEKAQAHNMDMDRMGMSAAIADERRGMWMGGGILVLLLAGAFVAGTQYDNNILAGILVGAAVLDAVALFVNRKKG